MPRPCKKRKICGRPKCSRFCPEQLQSKEVIVLSLDEYECIRLMDYEGLEQGQCAAQMGIARTTVQAVYKSAREKLARALVQAGELRIEGGDVFFCETKENCHRRHCCGVPYLVEDEGGNIQMRIAVTYDDGEVFQHFGHTEQFKLYDVENNTVTASQVVDTNGSGHGALAGFLAEHKVDVLICGGIGGGAQMALAAAGIKLYGGVTGSADAAVEALVQNSLNYNPDVKCNHHGHGDHHHGTCGEHGCGNHGGEGHSCGGL